LVSISENDFAVALFLEIRKKLSSVANPKKAPQMQAYMKSEMPFYGVEAAVVRKICKSIFEKLDLTSDSWEEAVLYIWRNAKFREERYAALHLCSDKRAREFQKPSVLKIYEEMIVTGAWWDYVDDISQKIGFVLRQYPKQMKPKMLNWGKSKNLWKRRASIICQLSFKEDTDLELLYACIEPSLTSKEFFLQKAIGWALRQYAWVDANEVVKYVKKKHDQLAPLSRREALRNNKLKRL